MKILHVTPTYEPAWHLGGVVRSVGQLCRGLARLGHEVTVFTTDSGGDRRMAVPLNQAVDLDGVTVHYFRTDWGMSFAYSRSLAEACRRLVKSFDIVNIHSVWNYPALPASREARRGGIPYIFHSQGSLAHSSLELKPLKKWLYFKMVTEKIARGAAAIRYTAELERVQTKCLGHTVPGFVVPECLDTTEFDHLPPKSQSKERWGVEADKRVVLFFGRLDARKAPDLLLKAFGKAANQLPETALIFAGPDFGMEEKLKRLTQELGLFNKVRFTGYVPPEERNSLLAAADILALTAHAGENFGNAAVEAMLAGVPVLLSEHVGISREVATDGTGVVTALEVDAISQALVEMLSDAGRLAAMGKAAATAARRRYDIDVVARQMVAAYEDILTGRRSTELSWSDVDQISAWLVS